VSDRIFKKEGIKTVIWDLEMKKAECEVMKHGQEDRCRSCVYIEKLTTLIGPETGTSIQSFMTRRKRGLIPAPPSMEKRT